MASRAFDEAVARRPPHGNGVTGDARACGRVAITSTTLAATALGFGGSGAYYTFVSSADSHIRFGRSNVAAATTSDYLMRAGQPEEFWCEASEDSHFTAIRDTADGALYYYRSG